MKTATEKYTDLINSSIGKQLYTSSGISKVMFGPDSQVLRRLIVFFSSTTGDLKAKPLVPYELVEFWMSLTWNQRDYYRKLYVNGEI